jgi:hypothetical protein
MQRPKHEVAEIIRRFGREFIEKHQPNAFQLRILDALEKCRTSALGGHKERCNCCGKERICYNSCRNRHCPKCQGAKQAFWVEDRMNQALNVKHYHIVFTVPEELNTICLLDSKWFYNHMFACVWSTLLSFGYSHFGVESGAICVLHTWGQNLCLHPHIHCIVPAAGFTAKGKLKRIGKGGRYFYPVHMLSKVFRGKIMQGVKNRLTMQKLLSHYQPLLNQGWNKPWVVYCEPSFGSPKHVVEYLGQYIHRVAISNHRILSVDNSGVTFLHKDYRDSGKQKPVRLSGQEFLRRFCLHILPYRFVKIRYYGIYSSRFKAMVKKANSKLVIMPRETAQERLLRLIGFDVYQCPFCKKGRVQVVEIIPRIRSPASAVYCFASNRTA